jgi:prephenate dehydratase
MPAKRSKPNSNLTFAFLGPVGTFTELALAQVKESKNAKKIAVNHVAEAIELVISGKVKRAIIPVENSIEGGVSATLDALAGTELIRIYGEYLVPVSFNLVQDPGPSSRRSRQLQPIRLPTLRAESGFWRNFQSMFTCRQLRQLLLQQLC